VDLFSNLLLGFSVAVSLQNLLYCFIGVLVGTLIGVLPGIGPLATIAMLLPITYNIPPILAILMLAGIDYGPIDGGSPPSILVNLPGEPAPVITRLDAYQTRRKGRQGAAPALDDLVPFFDRCVQNYCL